MNNSKTPIQLIASAVSLLLFLDFSMAVEPQRAQSLPRQTAGRDIVSYLDYGDRWVDGKVYQLCDVDGFDPESAKIPVSPCGGRADRRIQASGFFHTTHVDGRWWMVDPDGCLYFAVGVNQLRYNKDFGPQQQWAEGAVRLLRENGFNSFTEGAHLPNLQQPVPFASNLMLTFGYLIERHVGDKRIWDAPPLWDAELKQHVEELASQRCTPLKDNPYLIGWFTDNEMHWPADALDRYYDLYVNNQPYEITAQTWKGEISYTVKPEKMRSYQVVADWVEQHEFEPVNGSFSSQARQQFQEFQATQYAKLVHDAIRRVDPNHMLLGARHIRQDAACPGVWRGMGRFLDVMTLNYYGAWPPDPVVLQAITRWSGKPVMITEFFAQSLETKPRYKRDGWIVKTQSDRGKYYQNTALACLQIPECVGIQWFRYADSDDANFGIVSTGAEPYRELLQYMKAINDSKYELIDHLERQPLDLSNVYDPLRNTTPPDIFSLP